MCGIAGFNFSDKKLIKSMTNSLAHRGPDSEGIFVDSKVSLGHRRLAIVDLSKKGHQPMKFKHFHISFNGEIYNFREIRQQLMNKGHRFTSETDTEVILHSYVEWGSKAVEKFNGDWAFSIYDANKQEIFLSRDRFGVKPLYYIQDSKQFLFASEIKSLLKHQLSLSYNLTSLNQFWFQKYIGGTNTIYKQIYQLLPGNNALFNLRTGKFKISRYYNLHQEIRKQAEVSDTNLKDHIEELIHEAINVRLEADVPVGTFLSGGLDSSLISAVATKDKKQLQTFSISFGHKSYDESRYSQQVADHLQTQHQITKISIDDELLETVLNHLDQPFGDPSIIPTYLLSKHTKENVTVSLSGDGADEIFGGYDTYRAFKLAQSLPSFLIQGLKPVASFLPISHSKVNKSFLIKRFLDRYHSDPQWRHLNFMATFPESQRMELMLQGWMAMSDHYIDNKFDDLTQVQVHDMDNYLPGDILVKTDLASMMSGLEVRVPYLDHNLVPITLSLPEGLKIKNLQGKFLLKQIASSYLPTSIINRPKRGFTVPLAQWLKTSKLLQEYILSDAYYQHKLINQEYIYQLWSQQESHKSDNSRQLWLVAVFNFWWSKWGRSIHV